MDTTYNWNDLINKYNRKTISPEELTALNAMKDKSPILEKLFEEQTDVKKFMQRVFKRINTNVDEALEKLHRRLKIKS